METRNEPQIRDAWESGQDYERYVGRWSRRVADEFLDHLALPAGKVWLDVACGTGALTECILQKAHPSIVVGFDAALGFVKFAHRRLGMPGAGFGVGDALALPLQGRFCDVAVSGFALNFFPQPEQGLAQMARAVKSDGCIAVYVWDYAEGMQFMRHFWEAAAGLDPRAAALDEGRRFPLCNPEPLGDLFKQVGLKKVEVFPIVIPTRFADFDDFWTPFLGGQGPAPSYLLSLDEIGRTALRERIRAALPTEPDGAIPLTARAWAVQAVV